ncbi:MAG: hypothetical protein P9X22_06140 [Candidatus Zapsychrus exili]|nr:hypothetical protein [Candidatus Zapsychrus exili]
MKKIYMIVQSKDIGSALKSLRKIGTVHVEQQVFKPSDEIGKLKDDIKYLSRIVDVLSRKNIAKQSKLEDLDAQAKKILHDLSLIDNLEESIEIRKATIHKWEHWGDFNPADIKDLLSSGIYVGLFKIPVIELVNLSESLIVDVVSKVGGIANCIIVSKNSLDIGFDQIKLPDLSLSEMLKLQDEDKTKIEDIRQCLLGDAKYLNVFKKALDVQKDSLKFKEVVDSMTEVENLSWLRGFCPKEACAALKEDAGKHHWGLLIEEPKEDEQVPTLLRNPKWVELIKPVFSMIDILPGYKEVDISFFFLTFFSFFFGILIGDAGYGLIFLFSTFLAKVKLGKKVKDKSPFGLMYLLSIVTIIWGVLSGTFFGQQWLFALNIKALVPWLQDANNVQMLCFLIGAVHLSIAHIWRAILKFPHASFLGEVGWLLILWGMFFVAKMLVLDMAFPLHAKYLFMVGPALVIFFTKPNFNPLKAIGPGIGDFLLNIVNTFADIVSYIRLFAVGLASVAVADAFNSMALDIGFSSVLAGFLSAIILVCGHVFNIILGAMSILVHGLRLNVLEFSGHLNMEWAGFKYEPFKKR